MLNDSLITIGGAVKALGDGRFEAPLVRFSDADSPDLSQEFFDAGTDFWTEFPGTVPVLYDHGLDPTIKSKKFCVGALDVRDAGVWMSGQLNLADEYSAAIYKMMEAGKLGTSSGSATHLVQREASGKSFRITSWPLVEGSLTPTPCDPHSFGKVMPLKSVEAHASFKSLMTGFPDPVLAPSDADAIKQVVGARNLPIAPRDTAWDAAAAKKRIDEAAGDDKYDWYRKVFMVIDGEADKDGSYKLPFADVIDDKLQAVPKAIYAIAAVLNGARGGVELPDGDEAKVKALAENYYTRMAKQFDDADIKVPWSADEKPKKAMKGLVFIPEPPYLGDPDDILQGVTSSAVSSLSDRLCYLYWEVFTAEIPDDDKMRIIAEALDEYKIQVLAVMAAMPKTVDASDALATKDAGPLDELKALPLSEYLPVMGAIVGDLGRRVSWVHEQRATKQGRTISESNLAQMQAIHDGMQDHLAKLGDIIVKHGGDVKAIPAKDDKATTPGEPGADPPLDSQIDKLHETQGHAIATYLALATRGGTITF